MVSKQLTKLSTLTEHHADRHSYQKQNDVFYEHLPMPWEDQNNLNLKTPA